MTEQEEIREVRRQIRRINASLRIYQGRKYSNLEETVIARGEFNNLIKKRNAKGNIYFSEKTEDIKRVIGMMKVKQGAPEGDHSAAIERLMRSADRSTLKYQKERLVASGELPSNTKSEAFHDKIKKSEEVTNFIKDNKGSLYSLEKMLASDDSKLGDAITNLLDEMDSGHLSIESAYDAMMKIKKEGDDLFDNVKEMFSRDDKFKKLPKGMEP